MPLALSRDETADVWLQSDLSKPENERPTFQFFHLSRRERRKVEDLLKQAEAAGSDEECEAILDQVICLGLAGWTNMNCRDGKPIPFSLDSLDDVLTAREKLELVYTYPTAVTVIESKKKSALESQSVQSGAPSAAAAPADAPAPPPPPSP